MTIRLDRTPYLPAALLAVYAALALTAAHVTASDAPPAPGDGLTLADAAQAALDRNPELSAAGWDILAHDGRAVQAGLLPNPEMRAEVEDFGGSGSRPGFEQAQTTLSLAQLIELGGKRARR